ncbi:hypothetical protein SK128_004775 [Halocaridina rubra]|uniref:Delta-like protein n=1 Tax=Halocaridina rubra TaxID=373956 RepID=A0AAN8WEL5_HALRR
MTATKIRLFYLTLHLAALTAAENEEKPKSCEDLGNKDSHYICNEKGEIQCLAGWRGEKCDEPICAEGCHPQHGFCTQPGECRCELGWRGESCNECSPLPGCQHGYCQNGTFECICEDGWDGLFCSQPFCREGCHATRGYCERPGECKCRIGWGGLTCEECKPLSGCIHGNCTKPLECRCAPGWTGLFCNTPICTESCDKDHGTCDKPGECRCEVGWWGKTCSLCFPYPGCKNGSCKKPWECLCEPGWKGMLCDESDDDRGKCINNPGACLNGGTCIDVPNTGNFTCSCPSLFTGQRCDYLTKATSTETYNIQDDTEPTDSSQIQLVTADNSPSSSLLQAPIRSSEGSRKLRIDLDKEERRIILQNTARISFRQPKIVSKEDNQSNSLQFKVIERKLLPLPVFLPRVSEIIPGEEGPTRILKAVTKQPTPILVLESRSDADNAALKDALADLQDNSNGNQIDANRRFLRHHEGAFIPELEESAEVVRSRNPSPSVTPRSNRVIKVSSLNDQPLLVSAHASALPRPNPVSPATLRTKPIPSQRSGVSTKQSLPSTTTSQPPEPLNNQPPRILTTTSTTTPAPITSPSTPTLRTSTAHLFQSRSSLGSPIIESVSVEDVIAQGSEDIQTYYEENSNGRVHIGDVIGVDDAAPLKEIYEAFIELKKV